MNGIVYFWCFVYSNCKINTRLIQNCHFSTSRLQHAFVCLLTPEHVLASDGSIVDLADGKDAKLSEGHRRTIYHTDRSMFNKQSR